MDHPENIRKIIRDSKRNMVGSTCNELKIYLDFVEKEIIEDKKTELFIARINYICMAYCFRYAMERDYRCKQICKFLKKIWQYDDGKAKKTANKLNEARRTCIKLEDIVNNCIQCNLDIRDLTIKELYLASNLSWTLKRKAEIRTQKKVPVDELIEIDQISFEETLEEILEKPWYSQARGNPQLVANLLNRLSNHVVNESINYSSK